jgi:hypothetical protein
MLLEIGKHVEHAVGQRRYRQWRAALGEPLQQIGIYLAAHAMINPLRTAAYAACKSSQT